MSLVCLGLGEGVSTPSLLPVLDPLFPQVLLSHPVIMSLQDLINRLADFPSNLLHLPKIRPFVVRRSLTEVGVIPKVKDLNLRVLDPSAPKNSDSLQGGRWAPFPDDWIGASRWQKDVLRRGLR